MKWVVGYSCWLTITKAMKWVVGYSCWLTVTKARRRAVGYSHKGYTHLPLKRSNYGKTITEGTAEAAVAIEQLLKKSK